MIRSVELSLKFTNNVKRQSIDEFLTEYRRVTQCFIDLLWDVDTSKFVNKEQLDSVPTWLSARSKQCAGKQALAIIKGTLKKYKQRQWVKCKLESEGKKADHLQGERPSKPLIGNLPAELDSRFVKFDIDNETSFDIYITLSSLGQKLKVALPVKRTRVFNKWAKLGKLKQGCRLTNTSIIVQFECEQPINNNKNKLGIDIGIDSCLSLSNGVQINTCPHGHTLKSIQSTLARRIKGSKSFKRAQRHRSNFMSWCVNQLNKYNLSHVVIEDIKHLRKNKITNRFMSHWTYDELTRKLSLFCESNNVCLNKVNPAYTSQRCEQCGNVQTENRKGTVFKCVLCGYTTNADLNAARNILASL